jgi:mRNA interferase HigB
MRIISKGILREFWGKHSDSEQQLKSWFKETSDGLFNSPNDFKILYPTASILQNNRIVFSIKGNKYRIIVKVSYKYAMIWIRFVGTHAEYDKVDANKI